MVIDYTQIKTAEQRATDKLAHARDNTTNARASEYGGQDGTDKMLLEALLKKFKDDPDIEPIWQRRQEIQAAIPYPEEA